MSQGAFIDARTGQAGMAHLGAMFTPLAPLAVYLANRARDPFASSEAAKATNFSCAVLLAFILGTLVRVLVPLVGFVGTLAQWVVPLVGAYFCVMAWRGARLGTPASYPTQIKVVKTDD